MLYFKHNLHSTQSIYIVTEFAMSEIGICVPGTTNFIYNYTKINLEAKIMFKIMSHF